MKNIKIKLQDIKIHMQETAYDLDDLKNDLEVLDYLEETYNKYNLLFDITFGQYNSIEDFITAKKQFLEG